MTIDADTLSSRVATHQVVQDYIADAPACILGADGNGRIVAASDDALRLLGHTLSSIRELNVTELASPEEEVESERLWESFLRQRRQSGHFVLRHVNGRLIPTQYVAAANVAAGLSIAVHQPAADPKNPAAARTRHK